MKNKIIIVVLVALTAFSCSDFLDINKNPNQTTVSTPELVLTAGLNATAGQLFYNQMGAMWAGQWCPSGDVSGFVQEKTYDFNNTYGTVIWVNFYDILLDYKFVMDEAEATAKPGTAAIAKIMSTFLYHKLVDTYNNVPYTDALKGTTVIRPTYDNAQTVYEAIIDDLDEATTSLRALLAPGAIADNPGPADIVFGGDFERWIQFANTLKLRLLMRQSEMSGRTSYITTEISQIAGGGALTSLYLDVDANSTPGYLKTSGKQNPFWDNYYKTEADALRNNFNFYRSTTFLLSLVPTTDVRRYFIVSPTGSNVQSTSVGSRTGVQYGDESPSAYSNVTSGIGFGILKGFNMPMTIFTAAESYFLQSEAVLRGYMAGDAQALYEEGVRASFRLVGSTNTDANAHLATVAGAYQATVAQIITQKWVASVGYGGFEAWADYRRTGFPAVPLSTKAIKPNIPVRLFYPNQELQTNAENVALQGTADATTSKVFWDAN
jgi:hypothetical protein